MVYGQVASSARWTALDKKNHSTDTELWLWPTFCVKLNQRSCGFYQSLTGECSDFPLVRSFSRAVGLLSFKSELCWSGRQSYAVRIQDNAQTFKSCFLLLQLEVILSLVSSHVEENQYFRFFPLLLNVYHMRNAIRQQWFSGKRSTSFHRLKKFK